MDENSVYTNYSIVLEDSPMTKASKGHRSGGKYAGRHTTIIPAAESICDALHAHPAVKRISLGLIKSGQRGSGIPTLKIIDQKGCILLVVKGNATSQHVRVYIENNDAATLFITEAAQEKGFLVNIRERPG